MGFFNRRKQEARRRADDEELRRLSREREILREQYEHSRQQARVATRPDPTKPQSSLLIPQHLLDRANLARQRAQHEAAMEQFELDLHRIYPSPSWPSLPTLVRMFQKDWNQDTLPLKGIREVINLPNLKVDGIPDARTQRAIAAYRRLTDPDNLDTTAGTILDRFQHDVARIPPEEPLRPAEEIVDDLQDLLGELDDDPTT